MVISPAGLGAKNECAGEGQLQFTQNQMLVVRVVGQKNMVMGSAGHQTKNNCAVKASSKLPDQEKKS
jgi:hypothetical protein